MQSGDIGEGDQIGLQSWCISGVPPRQWNSTQQTSCIILIPFTICAKVEWILILWPLPLCWRFHEWLWLRINFFNGSSQLLLSRWVRCFFTKYGLAWSTMSSWAHSELGLKQGAQNGSPTRSGFEPRFYRWEAQCSTTELSHYPRFYRWEAQCSTTELSHYPRLGLNHLEWRATGWNGTK